MLFYFWRFQAVLFLEVLGIVWASLEFACGLLRIRRVRGFSINFKQRSRGDRGWQTVSECFPIFPHIFVWGSCFWLCTSASPLPLPPAPAAFLTHTHNSSHTTYSHTHNLSTHNLSTHNLSPHNLLTHSTWRHGRAFCVAGVALIVLGWLLWRAWALLGAVVAAAVCVAGMALRDIDLHFAWQAWHFATSTFTLRGRRGTWRHRPSLCVAGVALRDIDLHFAWQAWHLATSTFTLHGRRGTWRHGRAFCMAGVALTVLGWLWWHAWALLGAVVAAAVCVAGMALRDIDLHFAWQAWHFATSTFTLRGRRGTWRHGRAFCVADVALIVLGWLWWRAWASLGAVVAAAVCMAGVALRNIELHFAWQAWHLWHLQLVHLLLRQFLHIRTAHIHACTHTHTHAVSCTILSHTHTHHFYAPLHTLLSRTSLRHTFVAHADPSPSLISFLHFPSHLYLSFAAYWKKLTCGVIRSFNLLFEDVSISFKFSFFSNCNTIGSLNWFGWVPCRLTHACSELSLRILLWSESDVQKQSSCT